MRKYPELPWVKKWNEIKNEYVHKEIIVILFDKYSIECQKESDKRWMQRKKELKRMGMKK